MRNPDTGDFLELILSDEEWVSSQIDPQIIRDKIALKTAAEATRQADMNELRTAKVAIALATIASDLNVIDSATNLQVRAMLKGSLQREQLIIKALNRLLDS